MSELMGNTLDRTSGDFPGLPHDDPLKGRRNCKVGVGIPGQMLELEKQNWESERKKNAIPKNRDSSNSSTWGDS